MLHVSSEDVTDGDSYNGKFTLSQNISGAYQLVHYYLENVDYPWIYNGNNCLTLHYYYEYWDLSDHDNIPSEFDMFIYFSEQSSTDYSTIAAQMQTDIRNATITGYNGDPVSPFFNAVVRYDEDESRFKVMFNHWLGTTIDFYFEGNFTTVQNVFNKHTNESKGPSTESGSEELYFYIDLESSNVGKTSPEFVYVNIEEALSAGATTGTARPTLVLCTEDLTTGLPMALRNNISELNVSFYRPYSPNVVCPFTGKWDFVFVRK
jgi:hypothetical protein